MAGREHYSEAWRSRRTRIFALLASLAVFCAVLDLDPDVLGLVLGFAAVMATAGWLYVFRCPRCDEKFIVDRGDALPFTWLTRCPHCGLSINEIPRGTTP